MNVNPFRSVASQLGRLSIGISRTSIRLQHSKRKRKTKIPPNWEEGHGERIWIHNNFVNGLTIYSHSNVIKANKALKQIPFNGKKLKPAKIRKDFWRPMAMIQFPEGLGHVGRSVFHVMRELRMVHELNWGDEMLYHPKTNRSLTKHERGERLNDQKANSIADLAFALGGAGKGSHVWVPVVEGDENIDTSVQGVDKATGKPTGLVKATVFWMNEQDKNYAQSWPANVTHTLFESSIQVLKDTEEAVVEDEGEGGEGGEGAEASQTAPAELVAEEQIQKSPEQPRIP